MSWMKLISLVVMTILAGIGAGLGAHALMRTPGPKAGPEPVPATIGGLRLVVPADYVRGGAAVGSRINIVMRLPDMAPAASRQADPANLVFLSVMPSDGEIDPAQRVQDLYGRFFEAEAWPNPGGLLMRRFQAGSPYEDEEIYLAPPEGRLFSARCRKPVRGGERQPELVGETCLWRFRRDDADIQVRFSPERLPEWETLAAGVRKQLERWAGPVASR